MDEKTVGDSYNIVCPHCSKNNHYVTAGQKCEIGKITCFQKECFHCKKVIFYQAKYVIEVTAYGENPLS